MTMQNIHMRTNIEIDDALMRSAMRATGLKTKRAVVEEALRQMVLIRGQASIRELRGKIEFVDDLKPSRRSRFAK